MPGSVRTAAADHRRLPLHTRRSEFDDDQLQKVSFRCGRQTQEPFVKRPSIPIGQSFIQTELKLKKKSSKNGGEAVSVGRDHVSLFTGEKPMTHRVGQRGVPEIAQVSAVR